MDPLLLVLRLTAFALVWFGLLKLHFRLDRHFGNDALEPPRHRRMLKVFAAYGKLGVRVRKAEIGLECLQVRGELVLDRQIEKILNSVLFPEALLDELRVAKGTRRQYDGTFSQAKSATRLMRVQST